MVRTSFNFNFCLKIILGFIGGCFFVYALFVGQQIILPLLYATLISVLLNPIVNWLHKHKLRRVFAISVAVLIALAFTVGLALLVSSQLKMFQATFPRLELKFNELIQKVSVWISHKFNIDQLKVNQWMAKTRSGILENANTMIGHTLLTLTSLLIVVFLIPVYIFMLLFYKPLLMEFVRGLFDKTHHEKLEEVLFQSKSIVQSYLVGLLIEAVIVAGLNSTALLVLGIDYAILLGILGALLNVIPFIGGILSVAMPIIIALVTKDSVSYAILVLVLYMLIQFFDNHFITPKIVASKVKINALMAVLFVLVGNAIWGIPGMFLAIPLTGILKVIIEQIDQLKPWALLLGDKMPSERKFVFSIPKRRVKVLDRNTSMKAK
jgi:predicted PurR-regulated permease PerM